MISHAITLLIAVIYILSLPFSVSAAPSPESEQFANQLNLTNSELEWLDKQTVIRIGIDRDFAPYEWVSENGSYQGLAADYMKILEQKLGVPFEIIKNKPWSEVLDMAKQGQVDILSFAVITPERSKYLRFSSPYKASQVVIIDNNQGGFIGELDNLTGKVVAIEKGYFMEELLRNRYPNITLLTTVDTSHALELVAQSKADAYVGDAGSANYAIKKNGLLNLRFSGQTEFSSQHSTAVIKQKPELLSIINKALASLPADQVDSIYNRWLGLKIEAGIPTKTLFQYITFSFLLFFIFIFWIYRLRKEIKRREIIEQREQSHASILELLAKGERLETVLYSLIEAHEQQNPEMICSILMLDHDGQYLNNSVAPNLPTFYRTAIEGININDTVGACTSAAMTKEKCIISDIQNDDSSEPLKELAKKAGLVACSSFPILSSTDKLLGTFTCYFRKIHTPTQSEVNDVDKIAALASIAIEQNQANTELKIAATALESQEGLMITDNRNNILRVNQAFTMITGYGADEVIGKNPNILSSGQHDSDFYTQMWEEINAQGNWDGQVWNKRKNGEIYPQRLSLSVVKNDFGVITNYVASFRDVTDSVAASEEIKNLAFYDYLTHLPNRRLLNDRLKHAITSATRNGRYCALLFLDLDHFKTLNDTLGHDIGDLLLSQVSKRILSCTCKVDTVARLGGDEFIILLEDISSLPEVAASKAEITSNKIISELMRPYQLKKHSYDCTASIGISMFNDDSESVDELLKHADIAMYQAKTSGRNTLRFFNPYMQEVINERVQLEKQLRKAIDEKQFELFYQVQTDADGTTVGAEALIRWFHPEQGMISPVKFIPLSEDTGLILPIGEWVLETACAQLKLWQQSEHTKHLSLSLNVSYQQFSQKSFEQQVKSIVKRHNINPQGLKLELSESLLADDMEHLITIMSNLGELGIKFSLDDFGTGYSSLQYLKVLPLHQLKIDQSFVRDISTDDNDKAIVRTIIAMAHSLDLEVIAEGVETVEQRQFLLENNCSYYQGYLFSKPLPIDEMESQFLAIHQPKAG